MDERISALVTPSATMRLLPNKLHGDELVVTDGGSYMEADAEWLDAKEIPDLLRDQPELRFVMVDKSQPSPVVYDFRASGSAGWARIRPRYISDDGYPPAGFDSYFVAHVWSNVKGNQILVFELEC